MPRRYNRKKKRLFHGNQFTLTQLRRKRGNMTQENDEPSVIPDSLDSGDARLSPPLFDSSSSSMSFETLSDESEMELEVGYKAFESSTISASYKKMVLAKQVLEDGHADSQAEDDLVDHSEAVTGYRFVSMNQLADLCTLLRCPECSCDALTLQENHDRRKGLSSWLDIVCCVCGHVVSFTTSQQTGSFMDVNRRSVLAAREIGCGRARLETFCCMMDMPPPVAAVSFRSHVTSVHKSVREKCSESMHKARQLVKKLEKELGQAEEIINTSVSCDATWQRRGFASLYGVVFIISELTGQVLDYEFLSKTCTTCRLHAFEDPGSLEFQIFWEQHQHQCEANYAGTSPSMEAHGAVTLWKRSLDCNLRYLTFIGDGDSKSFNSISEAEPYGPEYKVEKSDCVGHVQKRMGTALRKIKKDYGKRKLSDGRTIGGAGRLTEQLCDDFQRYYGSAIRNNLGDLQGMVKAVKAILHHSWSTNEAPDHQYCPEGESSWCKFQRANSTGQTPPAHRTTIPKAVGDVIKPVFDRLSEESLLQRCLKGSTQNRNESLHATVWDRCPKSQSGTPKTVETAIGLAVINFNDGAEPLADIMQEMGLDRGSYTVKGLRKRDYKRLYHAKLKTSEQGKKRRKRLRNIKKGFEDKRKQKEGLMYQAGAFD